MPIEVLIVDDDITLRHMFVLQLDKLGYKADSAFNGVEAFRRVHNYEYKLILMDLQMPDMDGYEATAAIRAFERKQNRQPVPILALSANPDRQRCKDAGMDEVLEKPLSMQELSDLLRRYLPERCETNEETA